MPWKAFYERSWNDVSKASVQPAVAESRGGQSVNLALRSKLARRLAYSGVTEAAFKQRLTRLTCPRTSSRAIQSLGTVVLPRITAAIAILRASPFASERLRTRRALLRSILGRRTA